MQEDLDEHRLFATRLDAVDTQLQSIRLRVEAGFAETGSAQVAQVSCTTPTCLQSNIAHVSNVLVQQVLSELSALSVSLLDVRAVRGYVALNNQETARLQRLSREWVDSMTRTRDTNR